MPKANPKSALEKICRALCAHANNPPDIKFEGRPMWMSYEEEARAVLAALEPDDEFTGKGGVRLGIVDRE